MTTATIPETLTGRYEVDPAHTRVGFVARHAMVTKVRGSFNELEGSGYFDASDPSRSGLELVVAAASIDTRNEDRDGHLRSPDFFDVERYPDIRFASSSVEQVTESVFRVTGDLTIKGISRPLSFELEFAGSAVDPFGNQRIGLEGSVQVNRRDWDLTWNVPLDTGGLLVSEKVTLEFEVSAVRSS